MRAGNIARVRAIFHISGVSRHAAHIGIAGNRAAVFAIDRAAAARHAADSAGRAGRGNASRIRAAVQARAFRDLARHAARAFACGNDLTIIVNGVQARLTVSRCARRIIAAAFHAAVHGKIAHVRLFGKEAEQRLIALLRADIQPRNRMACAVKPAGIGSFGAADRHPRKIGQIDIARQHRRHIAVRCIRQRREPPQLVAGRNLIYAVHAFRRADVACGNRRLGRRIRRFRGLLAFRDFLHVACRHEHANGARARRELDFAKRLARVNQHAALARFEQKGRLRTIQIKIRLCIANDLRLARLFQRRGRFRRCGFFRCSRSLRFRRFFRLYRLLRRNGFFRRSRDFRRNGFFRCRGFFHRFRFFRGQRRFLGRIFLCFFDGTGNPIGGRLFGQAAVQGQNYCK